jgi:hypothetical protein
MPKHRIPQAKSAPRRFFIPLIFLGAVAGLWLLLRPSSPPALPAPPPAARSAFTRPSDEWTQRAYLVSDRFHEVYTPCWEGALGAIGDAYLFASTGDSSLLRFHCIDHDLRRMCGGTWVDDRAWVCLAELLWWDVTGRVRNELVEDAARRYLEAREQGRLSSHEGYWTWYNWPPQLARQERIFTNSNMNQMATVACLLYGATQQRRFLDDALLVWHGDGKTPGVVQTLYKGKGRWLGDTGRAAFGKELPWEGIEYCALGGALFRATREASVREVCIATASFVMDPKNGWVDSSDFYQLRMDGNGNFVQFAMDAYWIAPKELSDIPSKIRRMLDHVWTNAHGNARYVLHRESDNGIRNGWNPDGGEDGYHVDEVGTVHAQGEAMRAFGAYVYSLHPRR